MTAVVSLQPRVPHLVTATTMGVCFSKPEPVDDHLAKTTPKGKGKSQGGAQPVGTQPDGEIQGRSQPERELQGGTPSKRGRVRDRAILFLEFAGIVSEASDVLKPMKIVSEFTKKILQVTQVSYNLLDE